MKQQQGFTLIETLIAIFILTLTVGGLLELAAGGYFSVRYARNQIVADNLIQESLEYIRNDRDGAAQSGSGYWQAWEAKYGACTKNTGCIVDPYTTVPVQHIEDCSAYPNQICPTVTFYPSVGFYGYNTHTYPDIGQSAQTPYPTTYIRTVTMQQGTDPNQLTVTVTVAWMNGSAPISSSQSFLLTNWNP
jgi:prepilin-type N-terminal cleavage/methylation domain-containing protein